MPSASVASFLATLRRSQLLGTDRLAELDTAWQRDRSQSPLPLIRQLMASGELTEWQARFLLTGQHRLHISRYVLVERLGRDAVGDHFRARHIPLDRFVDLQILPPELFDQPLRKTAFLEHAQRVATLDHPAIVHVFDVDCEGRRYFVVSEDVEGRRADRFEPAELGALDIARMLADAWSGLAHAHDRSIVHGRLSLASLVRRPDGSTVVRDLALAPLLDDQTTSPSPQDARPIEFRPTDDVAAIGRLGRQLLAAHCADRSTSSERDFAALVERIGNAGDGQIADDLRHELADWISQHTPASPLADTSFTSSEIVVEPAPAEAPQPRPGQTRRRRESDQPRRRRLFAAALGLLMMAMAGGAVVWLIVRLTGHWIPEMPTGLHADLPDRTGSDAARDGPPRPTTDQSTPTKHIAPSRRDEDHPPRPAIAGDLANSVITDPAEVKTPVASSSPPPRHADAPTVSDVAGADPSMPATSAPDASTDDSPAAPDSTRSAQATSADPFAELPAAFELPVIDSANGAPVDLGRVHVDEGYLLGLELVSSADVARAPLEFRAERGSAAETWRIMMSQRDDPPREIAKVWKEDEQLRFGWSPAAAEHDSAVQLANCGLRLISNETSRLFPLRRAIVGPPLSLNDRDSQVEIVVEIPAPPHPRATRIEILPFADENYPEHSVDGDVREIRDRNQAVIIRYAEPDQPPLLAMEVTGTLAQRSTIRAALFINDGGDGIPFRSNRWNTFKDLARAQSQRLQAQFEEMKAYVASDGQKLAHRENTKKALELLEEANRLIESIHAMDAKLPTILARGVEYRIVFQLNEGTEVVLVDSRGPPPP
jgi:serine/threonine protein kinase